jgi:hypothetical protein
MTCIRLQLQASAPLAMLLLLSKKRNLFYNKAPVTHAAILGEANKNRFFFYI